jgi:RNA polymerase sigma factor (sigma-70 family)
MSPDDADDHAPQHPITWSELGPFFERNWFPWLRLLMYVGIDRHGASDALQEACVDLIRRVKKGEEIINPFTYVKVAAVRHHNKAWQREFGLLQRLADEAAVSEGGRVLPLVDERDHVLELVRTLPPRQRAAMACAIDGLSPSETAGLLGTNPGTIRANLRLARQRLKEALGDAGSANGGTS